MRGTSTRSQKSAPHTLKIMQQLAAMAALLSLCAAVAASQGAPTCKAAQRSLTSAANRLTALREYNKQQPLTFGSGQKNANANITTLVTIAIKTISSHVSRRASLDTLLRSIRRHYGASIRILVADDGILAEEYAPAFTWCRVGGPCTQCRAEHRQECAGRRDAHALVLFLDDDVIFDSSSRIEMLLAALPLQTLP